MIVDASAVIAIVLDEPDARRFSRAISAAGACRMPAPTWFETVMNVDRYDDPVMSRRLDDFFAAAGLQVLPFGPAHAARARQAWMDYGRGRHRAKLNFGDCMVYAVAKVENEPLLYEGNDFALTDIESALKD